MGVEIHFFLQKRVINEATDKPEWEDILLYKMNKYGETEVANIWRGSDITEISRKYFHMTVSLTEIKELAEKVDWWLEKPDEQDYNSLVYYAISFTGLLYLKQKIEIAPFPSENLGRINGLITEVYNYLTLTGNDYIDEDDIRIIGLVSY